MRCSVSQVVFKLFVRQMLHRMVAEATGVIKRKVHGPAFPVRLDITRHLIDNYFS